MRRGSAASSATREAHAYRNNAKTAAYLTIQLLERLTIRAWLPPAMTLNPAEVFRSNINEPSISEADFVRSWNSIAHLANAEKV